MAYGTVKVDNITFDDGGSDQNVTVSGLYNSLTSGITVTGTISGAVVIGSTSVSGTTVAGVTVTGTTVQGASGTFTSLTGTTTQGTTATYTTGSFTSLTGTTTSTTATYTTGSFTLTGTTTTGQLLILHRSISFWYNCYFLPVHLLLLPELQLEQLPLHHLLPLLLALLHQERLQPHH
jgi:hypothetical protein